MTMGAKTTDPSLSPAKVIGDRRDRPRGAALASSLPLPIRAMSLHVWTALRWAFWTARPMRASANAKASASVALDTTLS